MYSSMEPKSALVMPEKDDQHVTVHFEREKHALNFPLKCIITRKKTPKRKQITGGDFETCFIPYPERSERVNVSVSYNGFQEVSHPFEFTFYAPPPVPVHAFISQDGSAISVTFDRPVNICGLSTCPCQNLFTEETMKTFGERSRCKWATKQQVIIFVNKPFKKDQVELVIKSQKVREDQQAISEVNKDEIRITAKRKAWDGIFHTAITGPNLVPICGNVTLIGHYSSPYRGIVSFTWTVHHLDNQEAVSDRLALAVKEVKQSTLIVPAELMELEVNYTFAFLAASSDGISSIARHFVRRLPYMAPLVTTYSTALGAVQPISADEELLLFLDTSLPDCVSIPGLIRTLWTVSDPRVQFNNAYATSSVCRIEKNKLPEDSEIAFTASAYLGDRINETTSSTTIVRVAKMKMKAIIKGSRWRRAGDDTFKNTSLVIIDGSRSGGYNLPKKYVRYHWSCLDQDKKPCYDFSQETKKALLIERPNQTQSILTIHPKQLKAGQQLTISLRVYHALMPNQSSDTTAVVVDVHQGIIPQIMIEDITTKGYSVQEDTPGSGMYNVPADAPVVVHVTVLSRRFRRVSCSIRGAVNGFHYNYFNENNKKHMLLPEGFLVSYGTYSVHWQVCRRTPTITECHAANITLFAEPGVSMCRLNIQPYVALTWTRAEVIGCNIPHKRMPVTYQLFIHNNGERFAITGPQISNIFRFIGPQPPSNDDDAIFYVEVCDRVRQCIMFKSKSIPVEPNENETLAQQMIESLAHRASEIGDPIEALSLVVIASQTNDTTFLEENAVTIIQNVMEAIKLFPLLPGQAVLLYSVAQCLLKQQDKSTQKKALTAIEKSTIKSSSFKMPPNYKSLNEAYTLTANLIVSNDPVDQDLMKLIAKTQDELIKATAKSLPLGQKITLQSRHADSPVVLVSHTFINHREIISVEGIHNNTHITATIKFEFEVSRKFAKWDCGQKSLCEGVILVVTLYPGKSIHPENDFGKRVGPVVSLRFLTPITAFERSMYVKKGITVKLRATSNQTKDAQCYKWDESSKSWMQSEEENSLGVVAQRIECSISSHGVYTAIVPPYGMSGGTIAGITVATLMFVTIMGMVVAFFIRMKKQSKVSYSA